MEKLLIIGINTRGLINSALKLPYQTYSVSYYSTLDFKVPYQEKHVLNQHPGKSCGFFEKEYRPDRLLELSLEYMEEVDKIVLSTGISPEDFKGKFRKFKKKIIGNTNTDDLENKYKFYKKIREEYLTPRTFKIKYKNDISEVNEIAKQYEGTSFIIKPLKGSGGYGISYLKYDKENEFKDRYLEEIGKKYQGCEGCDFLVQEYIKGMNISSSVLSSNKKSKVIINSKILTERDFGKKNSFKYCGNIVPINYSQKRQVDIGQVNDISEKIIEKFKLIGSNGIDMIIDKKSNNNEPYIIEINPRFQGTYECVEEILGVNLLNAHIKACQGELIEIPKPKPDEYSIKRIIYSDKKIKVGDLKINDNIYDIPFKGVIIEKDEPLLTIVTSKNNIQNAKNIINNSVRKINENITILNYSNSN